MLKKVLISSLIFTGAAFSLVSEASNLTITNNTKLDSTCIINNGPCSTILGEIGVTHPGQTNVIPESKVKFACLLNKSNCKADVFMTNNCKGPRIATVIFDTNAGVKSISMVDNSYHISYDGFHISMSGGPQK